jgi:hypothetical protein
VPETDDEEVTFTISYETTIENNSHRLDHYASIKLHYEETYHKELLMTFSAMFLLTCILFYSTCWVLYNDMQKIKAIKKEQEDFKEMRTNMKLE